MKKIVSMWLFLSWAGKEQQSGYSMLFKMQNWENFQDSPWNSEYNNLEERKIYLRVLGNAIDDALTSLFKRDYLFYTGVWNITQANKPIILALKNLSL